jgi:hypothetical protein
MNKGIKKDRSFYAPILPPPPTFAGAVAAPGFRHLAVYALYLRSLCLRLTWEPAPVNRLNASLPWCRLHLLQRAAWILPFFLIPKPTICPRLLMARASLSSPPKKVPRLPAREYGKR